MNRSKKLPVQKDCGKRAEDVLEIVHTDVLGPINPEIVYGNRYAMDFVDSFGRYQKGYFLMTKDDAIEKMWQFFAERGKPGTLVCDGAEILFEPD